MDAVCFDMDGVIVNSEDYWIAREREEILPAVVPDADVPVEEVTGIYYREMYDVLAERYDVAVDREEFVALFDDVADEIYGEKVDLTDGVRDLIEEVRDRGVAVGMVTSSPPEWHDVVLERFDLGGLFDAVVCAADLDGPGKPDPGIYERAAAELDVAPDDAVAVEDSVNGIESARRAGMTVVGFGVGDAGSDLDDADVVADSPAALREAVLSFVENQE